MSCARRAFEEFSAFMADHAHAAPRRVSVPCEDIRAMLKNGKAPPAGAGGANTSCSGFLTGPRPPFALLRG
jgi:hypothetical protein